MLINVANLIPSGYIILNTYMRPSGVALCHAFRPDVQLCVALLQKYVRGGQTAGSAIQGSVPVHLPAVSVLLGSAQRTA